MGTEKSGAALIVLMGKKQRLLGLMSRVPATAVLLHLGWDGCKQSLTAQKPQIHSHAC